MKIAQEHQKPLVELLLSIADDKLILGHRNGDWTGLAPILEEDIAFSSLAQDDIAHAAALYQLVGQLEDRSADEIAYGRPIEAYRNCALVTLDDEFDWAVALVRQFFCDHFEILRLSRLTAGNLAELSALARRLLAEERLSLGHADAWVARLGQATADAHQRMQTALDRLAPFATGLFEPTDGVEQLSEAGIYPPLEGDMFDVWHAAVQGVVTAGGLKLNVEPWSPTESGGRRGVHDERFAKVLEEMTEVYRVEPSAQW